MLALGLSVVQSSTIQYKEVEQIYVGETTKG